MGPNYTPLTIPHNPPTPPLSSPRKNNKKLFPLLAVLVLMAGVIGGYFALNGGFSYKSRATGGTPPSCPTGTQLMINMDTHIGTANPGVWDATPMAPNGNVTAISGHWLTQYIDGVWMMGDTGPSMTVTYPSPVVLDTVLIYGNSESPWKINGVTLPTTGANEWTSFKLNQTTKEMTFDINGASSHLFNVCVGAAQSPTNTPTPAPTSTPQPNNTPTPKPSSTATPGPSFTPTMTPVPSLTNACPKPNPVKNLHITCPICQGQ